MFEGQLDFFFHVLIQISFCVEGKITRLVSEFKSGALEVQICK